MRRFAFVMPFIALILGIGALFLRYTEINTVFDATTGLPEQNALVTLILIGVSVVVILMAVIFGIVVAKKYDANTEYTRAFSPSGLLYLGVFFILGLGLIAAAVMYYLDQREVMVLLDMFFAAFAVLTGVSLIFLARSAYKGRGGSELCVFGVIPVFFMCIWLILTYKQHASDPVILDYAYECVAASAAALSFYFGAGYIFKKPKPGKTVFSYLLTIFFCTLVLADDMLLPVKIFLGVIIIAQFINCIEFIRNLKKKQPQIEE